MSSFETKVYRAKLELYKLLLQVDNPTDAEVNIMYELSKDEDIQARLKSVKNHE